jgi:ABC-2 type transport system permease protein
MTDMPAVAATAPRASDIRMTQTRVLRSEYAKFWSLRSNRIMACVVFLTIIGIAILEATQSYAWVSPADRSTFDSVSPFTVRFLVAGLMLLIVGALWVTGEYGTGAIRSTFTAVPSRLPVVWAKMIVFAVIVFAVTTVASFIAFFLTQSFLAKYHLDVTLDAPGVLRAVIGSGLYFTVLGLVGVAVGWITRRSAVAISAIAGTWIFLPGLVGLVVPLSVQEHVRSYLPDQAGIEIVRQHSYAGVLSPWLNLCVLLGYVVVLTAIAILILRKRDVLSQSS